MNEPTLKTLPRLIEKGVARGGELTILGRDRSRAVTRSHQELYEEAGRVAPGLVEEGIRPGDRIGVIGETSHRFVVALLGVWRAGATVVLLPERGQRSTSAWAAYLRERLASVTARGVLSMGEQLPMDLGVPAIEISDAGQRDPVTVDVGLDSLATILFTSGTTAEPKAIPITLERYGHTDRLRRSFTSMSGPEHHLFWWSPLHTGLSFHRALVHPLLTGSSLTYLPPRYVIAEPLRWLTEIADRGVTHSGGPGFGFEMVTRAIRNEAPPNIDLTSWEECAMVGERIDPQILEAFFDATTPMGLTRDAFVSTYACSEVAVITTGISKRGLWVDHVDPDALMKGDATPTSSTNSASFVSVGPVIDGIDMRILDEHGKEVGEREVGEVFVRAPGMMTNYIGAEGKIDWFATHDRAYTVESEVFLIGRLEELVIVRGNNMSLIGIESALRSTLPDDVSPYALGVRIASADEIVIVLGTAEGPQDGELETNVRRELWRRLSISPHDVVTIADREIPRSAGKFERAELKRRYLAGELVDAR